MESKLIKVKTDGDILRDAYVITGLEVDGSEYVVYYIDRDDGENDNLFVSKLIKNNDGTYNLLNIENANEKINISNTVKQIVKYAIDDAEHDTLVGNTITLGAKVIKLCPVIINKEQAIDIQKTYITTVKKTVTAVTKKYYDVSVGLTSQVVNDVFPVVEEAPVVSAPVTEVPQGGIVSSVTTAVPTTDPVTVQTVPAAVEPVLPTLEVTQPVQSAVVQPPVAVPASAQPVVTTQSTTPVLDIPAGMISTPVVEAQPVVNAAVQPAVTMPAGATIVTPQPAVVATQPIVQPAVVQTPVVPVPEVAVAQPVQPVVVQPIPTVSVETPVVQPVVSNVAAAPVVTPAVADEKLVLDASKESNLNSALGEISKESIPVENISAIKEFGEDDATPLVQPVQSVQADPKNAPKVLSKKAGFANSKFFMFVAVGFFVASCIFMGYEAFSYYQLVK